MPTSRDMAIFVLTTTTTTTTRPITLPLAHARGVIIRKRQLDGGGEGGQVYQHSFNEIHTIFSTFKFTT